MTDYLQKPEQWQFLDALQRQQLLTRPAFANDAIVQQSAAQIVARVRKDGDAAVRAITQEIVGRDLSQLRVDAHEIESASKKLTHDQRTAIETAAKNIETFHAAQMIAPIAVETADGVLCERLSRPIQRVGLYVPAGSAPLPSTALMLAIPARLAKCPVRVLCSPAQADGQVDAAVLYAAHICGIDTVFRIGGAEAIAAMAYGTESVPRVDKVFGPGNAWVTAAKAIVSRDPNGAAQDLPAGPSEVLVVADETANPEFVAADLLSQAEHGSDSQSVLVATSTEVCQAVDQAIGRQLAGLSRRDVILQSLSKSVVILVTTAELGIEVANAYAPEHLILQIANPRDYLDKVTAAGSVFLGQWAPESVGDYCSGTNHVLPTYGYARNYSSLGVADFCRAMTVQELTAEGIANIGPTAITLANLEGLDAHANAVNLRLAALNGAMKS